MNIPAIKVRIDSGAKASSIQASNIKSFKKGRDYQGRDDFNNLLLRIFSLFGLFTVLCGFLLWGRSSSTVRTLFKKSE